jgi:hypothetical protein
MGLGCVLALWALLGLAAAATTAIGTLILISGVRRRRTRRIVLGALLGSGGAAVTTIAVVFVAGWLVFGQLPTYSTSRAVFRDEFGFDAPKDVTAIQRAMRGSTDSAIRFLRFRSSPATVERIVSARFQSVPYTDCERRVVVAARAFIHVGLLCGGTVR